MKIKSISIESFNKISSNTYEFENFSYLKGKNGVGKTTVLQAIQVTLLGYIPGTNKKTAKDVIFNHSKDGDKIKFVLTLDDNGQDVVIERSWNLVKSTIKTTVSIDPTYYSISDIIGKLELPVFNFNEFAGMAANKLKDWFLDFLPSSSSEIDWGEELYNSLSYQQKLIVDSKFRDFIPSTVDGIKSSALGLNGLDEVRKANEYIKNSISFEKKEIERITGAIQSLVISDDFDPSVDIEALKAEVDRLHSDLVDMKSRLSIINSQKQLQEDLAKLAYVPDDYETCEDVLNITGQIEKLNAQVSDRKHHLDELKDEIQELSSSYTSMQNVLKGKGICPFTKEVCRTVEKTLPNLEEESKATFTKIAELKAERVTYEVATNQITELIQSYNDRLSSIKQDCAKKKAVKSQLREVETVSEIDIATKSAEYDKANDAYITAVSNIKSQKLIDQFTEQKYEAELKLKMYKVWDKLTGVNGLQCDPRLGNPFEKFSTEMDKYIPELFMDSTVHTKFNAESTKANSFSFGITRDGRYIKYDDLSSGEKCLFTFSMLMSITYASDAPLKILVVDDLLDHLDSDRINNLFRVLSKQNDIQVICAGVKEVSSDYDDFVIEIK